jgi:hypothetical protein
MPDHIRHNVISWNRAALVRAKRQGFPRHAARFQRNIQALGG